MWNGMNEKKGKGVQLHFSTLPLIYRTICVVSVYLFLYATLNCISENQMSLFSTL